jgi:hypothetical protein
VLEKLNSVVKEGFSRYVPDDDYPGKYGVKECAKRDEGVREYLAELGIPLEHVIGSSVAVGFIEKESPVPQRKGGTINIVR